jgi:hypothetical protein
MESPIVENAAERTQQAMNEHVSFLGGSMNNNCCLVREAEQGASFVAPAPPEQAPEEERTTIKKAGAAVTTTGDARDGLRASKQQETHSLNCIIPLIITIMKRRTIKLTPVPRERSSSSKKKKDDEGRSSDY